LDYRAIFLKFISFPF